MIPHPAGRRRKILQQGGQPVLTINKLTAWFDEQEVEGISESLTWTDEEDESGATSRDALQNRTVAFFLVSVFEGSLSHFLLESDDGTSVLRGHPSPHATDGTHKLYLLISEQ